MCECGTDGEEDVSSVRHATLTTVGFTFAKLLLLISKLCFLHYKVSLYYVKNLLLQLTFDLRQTTELFWC